MSAAHLLTSACDGSSSASALGRDDDVRLVVRAWPLEVVNGAPLDVNVVVCAVNALRGRGGARALLRLRHPVAGEHFDAGAPTRRRGVPPGCRSRRADQPGRARRRSSIAVSISPTRRSGGSRDTVRAPVRAADRRRRRARRLAGRPSARRHRLAALLSGRSELVLSRAADRPRRRPPRRHDGCRSLRGLRGGLLRLNGPRHDFRRSERSSLVPGP